MPTIPPHLLSEEELIELEAPKKVYTKFGPQGPSKYGPGGSRIHKALGRSKKNN